MQTLVERERQVQTLVEVLKLGLQFAVSGDDGISKIRSKEAPVSGWPRAEISESKRPLCRF